MIASARLYELAPSLVYDKVNVVGVRVGLKSAICCGEIREDFLQPVPTFGQPYPHDLFADHIFLLSLAAGITPNAGLQARLETGARYERTRG
jgi:hypothetical protein